MVKMSDIAKRCGVSRATVSAVLNGHQEKLGIKPETADRVRAAAEKLGYFRNEMAVAVKTGQNAVIGCLTIGLNREWVARVVCGLLQTVQEEGYLIKIVNLDSSEASLDSLRRLVRQRMAGIFCCDVHPAGAMGRQFRELCGRYAMPIVAINSGDSVGGYQLRSNDMQGTEQAVNHLWKLGHRRIAHIAGSPDSVTARLRREGFLRAMKARGIVVPASYLVTGNYDSPEESEAAARKLFSWKGDLPTAVFCANDEVAAATLRTVNDLGLRVPESISIVGYSDIKVASLTTPPLTTVRQPFEKMGARGATVLLELIRKESGKATGVEWLPTKLIARASTRNHSFAR